MRVNANQVAGPAAPAASAPRRLPGQVLAAALVYTLLAVSLTWSALLGRTALGPERILDWDPLLRTGPPPDLSEIKITDYTPAVLDLPRDLAFARGLRQGRIDLWNPLAGAGAPLWAEQGGPFFPLKLVFYLMPTRAGYDLFLTLRLVVAALGAFLLARARGLPFVAALAAGAMFELSGAMLGQLPFGAASPSCVLPWVLLAGFAIVARPTARRAGAAGVALGITASGGHPTLVLLVFAAFAAFVVGQTIVRRPGARAFIGIGVTSAAAVVLGLAIAAPSLLPLAELTGAGTTYKQREVGEVARQWSLDNSRGRAPAALIASAFWGTVPEVERPADLAASIGTLALATAVLGIATAGMHAGLVAVALLGLALTLSPPLLGRVAALPGLHLILPAYGWPLVALALTQAVGAGIERLRTVRPAIAVAAGALLIAEQWLTMAPFVVHPAADVLRNPPSPAVAFLGEQLSDGAGRMVALPHRVGFPNSPSLFGIADLRSLSALPVRRQYDYLRAIGPGSAGFTVQDVWRTRSPLLDIAAVRYVVLPEETFPLFSREWSMLVVATSVRRGVEKLPIVYRDDRVRIHRNPDALPRVRIAHRVQWAPDRDAATRWAKRLRRRSESARALDLIETVVLEPDEHGRRPPFLDGQGSPGESVRLIPGNDPDWLRIEARLATRGVVVVADTYYPGWNAWVDGLPAPIFPADLMFRGVHVGAGEHVVELGYGPRSFRWGVVISAVACALVAMLLLLPARSRVAPGGSGP